MKEQRQKLEKASINVVDSFCIHYGYTWSGVEDPLMEVELLTHSGEPIRYITIFDIINIIDDELKCIDDWLETDLSYFGFKQLKERAEYYTEANRIGLI